MRLIGEAISAIPAAPMGEQTTEHQERDEQGQDQDGAGHGLHLRGKAMHQTWDCLRARPCRRAVSER